MAILRETLANFVCVLFTDEHLGRINIYSPGLTALLVIRVHLPAASGAWLQTMPRLGSTVAVTRLGCCYPRTGHSLLNWSRFVPRCNAAEFPTTSTKVLLRVLDIRWGFRSSILNSVLIWMLR